MPYPKLGLPSNPALYNPATSLPRRSPLTLLALPSPFPSLYMTSSSRSHSRWTLPDVPASGCALLLSAINLVLHHKLGADPEAPATAEGHGMSAPVLQEPAGERPVYLPGAAGTGQRNIPSAGCPPLSEGCSTLCQSVLNLRGP